MKTDDLVPRDAVGVSASRSLCCPSATPANPYTLVIRGSNGPLKSGEQEIAISITGANQRVRSKRALVLASKAPPFVYC